MRIDLDDAIPNVIALASRCYRPIGIAAVAAVALFAAPAVAHAQNNVVVVVNGEPITVLDVEQRGKFLQLANNKPSPRVEIIQELIDEKIKLFLLKRFDFGNQNLDNDVNNAIYSMARRRNLSQKQFSDELNRMGVLSTLKSRLKAEIIWTPIVRGKYQGTLQLNDNEILKELESRNSEQKEGYDYTLRPILFIIPHGAPPSLVETRRREAEGLRSRFQSCEDGLPFARALRDVAVREPTVRSSADLPPAQREILEKTEIGRLTPPETTPEGIVVYALCSKKLAGKDSSPDKRQLRQEIYSKAFEASSKKFLKELREQAYCTLPDNQILKGCIATTAIFR